MATFDVRQPWVLIFGVLGNIISIFVYFAPLPTFVQIYRRKSTLRFQSVPYVVALFSAMLWMYYAFLKTDTVLIITVNSVGCVIETIYIFIFIVYASKEARSQTMKEIGGMNVGLFSLIYILTFFLAQGSNRVAIVGWICVAVSVSVFAAPLSIVFQVVRTRSVEFMPFTLSFCLTISAVMWFAYGLLQKDLCVAIPNVFGFILGLLQMLLYGIYRSDGKKVVVVVDDELEKKLSAEQHIIINMVMIGGNEVYPLSSSSSSAQTSCSDDSDEDGEKGEKKNDETSSSSSSGSSGGVGSSSPDHHHSYSAQKNDQRLDSPPPVVLIKCTAA